MPQLITFKHTDTGRTRNVKPAVAAALRSIKRSNWKEIGLAADPDQMPADDAKKADWVAWAAANGVEDADKLTVAELKELAGSDDGDE